MVGGRVVTVGVGGSGVESLSRIRPVAVPVPIPAPFAFERVTRRVSVSSSCVSWSVCTAIVFVASPGLKVSVPCTGV